MCKAKVLAIIVTYNPEIIRLTECINSLAPQVGDAANLLI